MSITPSTARPHEELIQIFLNNQAMLVSIARRYVHDEAAAEDIVQETITKILELSVDKVIDTPKAYLITAVRNRALNYLARSKKMPSVGVDNLVLLNVSNNEPLIEQSLADKQKLKSLTEAMETLPTQCKRVLILRKFQGLSLKQTAAELGISVSTVQKHLTKALIRCTAYLTENGHN